MSGCKISIWYRCYSLTVGLAYVFVSQHVLRLKCCIVQLIKYVINKISQSCNVKQVYKYYIQCYLACLRVINHVMKQGAVKANTVGSIAVMYSGFGVILAWLRGTEDELNTIVSATTTGLIYRSTGTSEHLLDYVRFDYFHGVPSQSLVFKKGEKPSFTLLVFTDLGPVQRTNQKNKPTSRQISCLI